MFVFFPKFCLCPKCFIENIKHLFGNPKFKFMKLEDAVNDYVTGHLMKEPYMRKGK